MDEKQWETWRGERVLEEARKPQVKHLQSKRFALGFVGGIALTMFVNFVAQVLSTGAAQGLLVVLGLTCATVIARIPGWRLCSVGLVAGVGFAFMMYGIAAREGLNSIFSG